MICGSVSIYVGLWFSLFRHENGYGDCLGLSGHASLGLNRANLGKLVGFEVSMALLEVVLVKSRDSRRKRLL